MTFSATMLARASLATLAGLAFLGGGAWIYELMQGLAVTGMRDVISWGLYIVTFAFFVKLSAGGLIVASVAEVFGVKAIEPLARIGVLTAAICVLVAGLFVVPDLGRPERALNILLYANLRSPMVWDITIISLYFLLSASKFLLMSIRPTPYRKALLKIFAIAGFPAAFALHSITAWIFGVQISRPFWNTAVMAPLFVVSAIAAGTSLVALIAAVLGKVSTLRIGEDTWKALAMIMSLSLAVDLFFVFSEYVTILWGGVPDEMAGLKMLLPGGPFFWLLLLEWIVGGALPFALLVMPRTACRADCIVGSAVLILVGIYAFQIQLSSVGMANPLIQLPPGLSLGTFDDGVPVFQIVGRYVPTWVEYAILAGLTSVAVLLFAGIYRLTGMGLDRREVSDVQA